MKYLKWALLSILDVAFNIIAYITDPIVLLFADEVGNLPGWALWWANWDDHLDIDWMVDEGHVPDFACYDFHRHYKYHPPEEAEATTGVYCGYVDLLDPDFTWYERFQRYICRLWWLWRNNAYGFSYYVTGVDVYKVDIVKIKTEEADGYIYYETDYAWVYKDERPSFGGRCWDNFVGWKMQSVTADVERCMLAFRITPFDKKE